jgi:hypothetical protein
MLLRRFWVESQGIDQADSLGVNPEGCANIHHLWLHPSRRERVIDSLGNYSRQIRGKQFSNKFCAGTGRRECSDVRLCCVTEAAIGCSSDIDRLSSIRVYLSDVPLSKVMTQSDFAGVRETSGAISEAS